MARGIYRRHGIKGSIAWCVWDIKDRKVAKDIEQDKGVKWVVYCITRSHVWERVWWKKVPARPMSLVWDRPEPRLWCRVSHAQPRVPLAATTYTYIHTSIGCYGWASVVMSHTSSSVYLWRQTWLYGRTIRATDILMIFIYMYMSVCALMNAYRISGIYSMIYDR